MVVEELVPEVLVQEVPALEALDAKSELHGTVDGMNLQPMAIALLTTRLVAPRVYSTKTLVMPLDALLEIVQLTISTSQTYIFNVLAVKMKHVLVELVQPRLVQQQWQALLQLPLHHQWLILRHHHQ